MGIRRGLLGAVVSTACVSAVAAVVLAGSASAAGYRPRTVFAAFAVKAPATGYTGKQAASLATCSLPDGSTVDGQHCYTPEQR
jgi:hypothetical protein